MEEKNLGSTEKYLVQYSVADTGNISMTTEAKPTPKSSVNCQTSVTIGNQATPTKNRQAHFETSTTGSHDLSHPENQTLASCDLGGHTHQSQVRGHRDPHPVAMENISSQHKEIENNQEKKLKFELFKLEGKKDLLADIGEPESHPCGQTAHGLTIPIAIHRRPDHTLHPDNRDRLHLHLPQGQKGHTPGRSPGLKTKHPKSKNKKNAADSNSQTQSRSRLTRARNLLTKEETKMPLVRQRSDPVLRSPVMGNVNLGSSPQSDSDILEVSSAQLDKPPQRLVPMVTGKRRRSGVYEPGNLSLFDEDSNTDDEIMV